MILAALAAFGTSAAWIYGRRKAATAGARGGGDPANPFSWDAAPGVLSPEVANAWRASTGGGTQGGGAGGLGADNGARAFGPTYTAAPSGDGSSAAIGGPLLADESAVLRF